MHRVFSWVLLVLLLACSGQMPLFGPAQEFRGLRLLNPCLIDGELTVIIKNIKPLQGTELAEHNRDLGLPEDKEPELKIWSSEVINRLNQEVKFVRYSIEPTSSYVEKENGNKIIYWELTDRLKDDATIELRRRFQYITYETKYEINPDEIGEYDQDSRLYKFYTKSEPFIELSQEIVSLAEQIVGTETNPYFKARAIYSWLLENISYHYPPEKRSAEHCLKTRRGDCGQFAYLFCALCRAVGVPARFVGGFWFTPKRQGFHAWAEFYLPGYGWLPVDPSEGKGQKGEGKYYYFGNLDNERLITSKGMNIPIRPEVDWANFSNSGVENGRTDFMQLSTRVSSGFTAQITSDLKPLAAHLL